MIDAVTLNVSATVPTRVGVSGASTSTMVVDTKLNKIYVANAGNIQIIDGVTNQISKPVALTRALQSVAFDPQTGHMYVEERFTGEIKRVATVEVGSPSEQHVQANPQLGTPLGGPRPTPDGLGVIQSFENGTAVSTTDYGAVALNLSHADVWAGAAQPTAIARAMQPDLGNPVGDSMSANGVPVTHFERGMIVTTTLNRQPANVAVSDPIWERYRGINDIGSFLDLPVSYEEDAPGGGRHQDFEHGHAYYRADTGAQFLNGPNFSPVHDTWLAVGGTGGWLGYPIADEKRIPASPVAPQCGRICRFEHGTVVWNADLNQTFLLTPEFVRTLLAHDGSAGSLGLPVLDPTMRPVPETQARYVNFKHGYWSGFPPVTRSHC